MKKVAALPLAILLSLVVSGCSPSGPTVASTASPTSQSQPTDSLPPFVAVDFAHGQVVAITTRGGQSPDGSRILTGGGVGMIGGGFVGSVSASGRAAWQWADDSRHLCAAYHDSQAPPANDGIRTPTGLYETLPGSAPVLIAQVGYLMAQAGPFILGCSFGHGTATVGESCVNSLCETWTVDLLSHRIVSHLSNFGAAGATGVLEGHVSPDGTLLAVSESAPVATTIYRTADGEVVATLNRSRVVAFTADDSAVLVTHATGPAQLLNLRGTLIATLPGNEVQATLAEPGGTRIAVALGRPGATSFGYPGPSEVVFVGTDGQVKTIAKGVLPQF